MPLGFLELLAEAICDELAIEQGVKDGDLKQAKERVKELERHVTKEDDRGKGGRGWWR
jgi:hypothetical protein